MRNIKIDKKKKSGGKATISLAYLESNTSNGAMAEKEITPFNSRVSIHVHSKRKRLVDADAVSAKAAIDGLVHAGLLQDDSPKYVEEVSYTQEKIQKGETEETIITIEEV
jgi:hypothetical protein